MTSLMTRGFSRRAFLTLPLAMLLPLRAALGTAAPSKVEVRYRVELGVLFDLFTFTQSGTAEVDIDRARGRYRVLIVGEGSGSASRTETTGLIRGGRFMPHRAESLHWLRGRENRLSILFDYERGRIVYDSVGHTLLLGRRREVHDIVGLPAGQPVDDAMSVVLNFADDRLPVSPDGSYVTSVIRRSRPDGEGVDDISRDGYRVEIVPFRFRVTPEGDTGRLVALIDLTRWSTWARQDRPARVTFGPDRLPESIEASLILGSSLKVRLA